MPRLRASAPRGTGLGGPPACVLGDVDLVRALALGGIPSVVVAGPGNPARYSRAAVGVVERADPFAHPDVLLERLLEFGRGRSEPPVLFYDADWDLLLVSRRRDALAGCFRFVIGDAEVVEAVVDKAAFQALADRVGLPVPPGWSLDDALRDDGVRFPVLVKPITRLHETWKPLSSAKAVRVGDRAALDALAEDLRARGIDAFVQQEVPGPETRIESYHVYVDAGGAIAGEFTGRKVRTHPPRFGYSTALVITHDEDVIAAGRDVMRRVGLQGVAKLDFKRDDEGRLHLLEINPRFNLWHHPGALAGVNLPALVYADLVGLPSVRPATWRAGVRWCSLAHDLQAARADGIPVGAWLRGLAQVEAKSGFAWDDPLPLPRAALGRLTAGRGRSGRRAAQAVA